MAKIKVGDYLFQRLAQLNIKTVWGVPGDYELALLDLIGDAGIRFSGNANELIASYAADGYSRLNGAGALVTTYGPGELSAYCGHAGAYAEFCPVVHIVGYPGVTAMKNKTLMHHSLGTGEFDMYHEMIKHISADTTVLTEISTAVADIDRCLNSMLYHSRPVYIGVPVDMSHRLVSADGLKTPLRTELPPNDQKTEASVVDQILQKLGKFSYPVIIADGNAVRDGCVAAEDRLAEITGFPYFTTCMGKGGPNEDLPNFGGVYQGAGSTPDIKKAVESADCVLWLGSFRLRKKHRTDFNSGEFTDNVATSVIVDMQRFFTKVGAHMAETGTSGEWENSQSMSSAIVLTASKAFGAAATKLPKGCLMYNQTIFGSIGYAGPSAAGAFQAAKESGRLKRGIVITGEGSLQLTPMCFADMLKLDHKPIVFVLNNNGYTVERLIHGKDASYNTLPLWDYDALRKVFGPAHPSRYYGPIKTREQFDSLLKDEQFQRSEIFQLVELVLDELDAPLSVRLVTSAIEEFNQKHAAGASMAG
ncbi:hypothetical protein M409DRAFT_71039 [Zasmidium cellare ATCC 36951]|uniref:Pyruvate decarboxylase n=1 Tax=Zasmidium cellare ATCC 36951 TaxID=1080233 RepID=A0A6A6BX01_ZASCE|nr:uncharacterized protein M409DRAFT_71039 [Zasmidium cellare ATCC 36951]KAF2159364.1 hypothetical protein M409DRAFT_71039 [Zasmidium cellare ATCC 36951]